MVAVVDTGDLSTFWTQLRHLRTVWTDRKRWRLFLLARLAAFRWSAVKTASGLASLFIPVNSLAGLAGNWASAGQLTAMLPLYGGAVLAGALVGTTLGIRVLPTQGLLKALGVVLVIAGMKMIGVYCRAARVSKNKNNFAIL